MEKKNKKFDLMFLKAEITLDFLVKADPVPRRQKADAMTKLGVEIMNN